MSKYHMLIQQNILKLFMDENFELVLQGNEQSAWEAFRDIVCLGNRGAPNFCIRYMY